MNLFSSILMIVALMAFASMARAEDQVGVTQLSYAGHEDVRVFAKELAAESTFTEKQIISLFYDAQYKQKIIDAISRPAEHRLNWSEYQDIFLTERRTKDGITFMHQNKDALQKAYELFGVPAVIITAIIGVETMYGRISGGYRVIDALSTLAFNYPPRAKFFRQELKEFILLAREEKQMITELKGSYAGAMGLGQFIPSSYRRYAIDFDEDGFRDIWHNRADAIGSVANYLAEHGWQRDRQIAIQVEGAHAPEELFDVSLKPSITAQELMLKGITTTLSDAENVSPMRLMGKQGAEYWLGLPNFYVITRYNHSKLYAMAVFQLSEDLSKGYSKVAAK